MNRYLGLARDGAISRIARLADHEPVAELTRQGILAERRMRAAADLIPHAMRAYWGLASRAEIAATLEQLAALEERLRRLESGKEER